METKKAKGESGKVGEGVEKIVLTPKEYIDWMKERSKLMYESGLPYRRKQWICAFCGVYRSTGQIYKHLFTYHHDEVYKVVKPELRYILDNNKAKVGVK